MRKFILFAIIAVLAFAPATLFAETGEKDNPPKEGNVWTTENGTKYFTCPVMLKEMQVSEAPAFSVVEGVKYYHCCPPCQGPFRANPQKYLKDFAVPGNVIMVDEEGAKHFRDPVTWDEGIVSGETVFSDLYGCRFYFSNMETAEKFSRSPVEYIEKLKHVNCDHEHH